MSTFGIVSHERIRSWGHFLFTNVKMTAEHAGLLPPICSLIVLISNRGLSQHRSPVLYKFRWMHTWDCQVPTQWDSAGKADRCCGVSKIVVPPIREYHSMLWNIDRTASVQFEGPHGCRECMLLQPSNTGIVHWLKWSPNMHMGSCHQY